MWQGDVDWTRGRLDADALRDHAGDARQHLRRPSGTRSIWPRPPRTGWSSARTTGRRSASARGDAKDEADHFVDVAQNAAGDVLPALDIEEHNGLTVRAADGLGAHVAGSCVQPDGRARDDLLESPLLAHVPRRHARGSPTTDIRSGSRIGACRRRWSPAGDWGGHGWTFWQWTSTGRVSGIGPNVDRDRFNGTGLVRGKIASLTVTPAAGGVHHRRPDRVRRRRDQVQQVGEPGHA